MQETSAINKGRYYVYGLFKPCGTPFYIGKGSGTRVNDHFKPSNLKVNTPKTGIIKKYGNSVIRSILCYFDSEESAYEYEEWLISHYGLKSEGGLLANYAKSRFEYSDMFARNISSKGHLGRDTVYPDWLILSFIGMYESGLELDLIHTLTGIPKQYMASILMGRKRGYLIPNPPKYRVPTRVSKAARLSEQETLLAIGLLSNGCNSWSSVSRFLCKSVKTIRRSLPSGFLPNLNKKPLYIPTGKKLNPEFEAIVLHHVIHNLPLKSLMNSTGKAKSTCFNAMIRVKRVTQQDGMKTGKVGNGTSDNVAQQDNSANNLSNK